MVFGGGGGDDAAYRDIVFGDARSASTSSGGAGAAGGGLGKDEWHAGAASGDGEGGLADWMRIDIAALDGCLRRAPIHERLKLPRHVGEHLEGRYGVGSGSGSGGGGRGRTKTLAELREESRCVFDVHATELDDRHRVREQVGDGDSSRTVGGGDRTMATKKEKEEGDSTARASRSDDEHDADDEEEEEEEEDLEAWLDDMIA